jgi:AhpD family alkylhydroperoxidase
MMKQPVTESGPAPDRVTEFRSFRERMNKRILSSENRAVKRFFGVDTLTYEPGALPVKTKEMLGLATSMVLRCDDCVSYHIEQCRKEGVTDEEFFDIFSVALTVGGSIVIPHLRRAVDYLDQLKQA